MLVRPAATRVRPARNGPGGVPVCRVVLSMPLTVRS